MSDAWHEDGWTEYRLTRNEVTKRYRLEERSVQTALGDKEWTAWAPVEYVATSLWDDGLRSHMQSLRADNAGKFGVWRPVDEPQSKERT